MRLSKEIPSLYRPDGSLKEILTISYTPKNYRRIFPNQTFPVLNLFANKATLILLYLLFNADSNNLVYCTYADIMRDCQINDRKVVSQTLKDLKETKTIVEVAKSCYMINPAIQVQGNDKKFGLLASEFNRILHQNQTKKKNKQEGK